MKKTKLLLAYPDRWEEVDAYEAFSYETHLFYVHKVLPQNEKWRVSHSCGAGAGPLMPTRAAAIKRSLLEMSSRGITKEKLDAMVEREKEQMEGVALPEQKNEGGVK